MNHLLPYKWKVSVKGSYSETFIVTEPYAHTVLKVGYGPDAIEVAERIVECHNACLHLSKPQKDIDAMSKAIKSLDETTAIQSKVLYELAMC